MQNIDPACELEGLVVVVEIILEFGGKEQRRQQHLVNVLPAQTEIGVLEVVAIDVDDRNHQALARKLGVIMEAVQKFRERDRWRRSRVEDRRAEPSLLLD